MAANGDAKLARKRRRSPSNDESQKRARPSPPDVALISSPGEWSTLLNDRVEPRNLRRAPVVAAMFPAGWSLYADTHFDERPRTDMTVLVVRPNGDALTSVSYNVVPDTTRFPQASANGVFSKETRVSREHIDRSQTYSDEGILRQKPITKARADLCNYLERVRAKQDLCDAHWYPEETLYVSTLTGTPVGPVSAESTHWWGHFFARAKPLDLMFADDSYLITLKYQAKAINAREIVRQANVLLTRGGLHYSGVQDRMALEAHELIPTWEECYVRAKVARGGDRYFRVRKRAPSRVRHPSGTNKSLRSVGAAFDVNLF